MFVVSEYDNSSLTLFEKGIKTWTLIVEER